MPTTKTCSFCGGKVNPGKGLMLVKTDGTILYFCSSKCRKNMSLGRKPENLKWTEKSRKSRE